MSNSIQPLVSIQPLAPLENQGVKGGANGEQGNQEFSAFLKDALNKVNSTELEAQQATVDLVTGQAEDFHTPVIAMEKANLTLGLAVNVRNKVLEAYHEIMRMQI